MQNEAVKLMNFKKTDLPVICAEWDTIKAKIQEHFAGKTANTLVTMHHGICMGSFQDGEFIMPASLPLEAQYLRSLRVFDKDSECYVWRNSLDATDIFRLRIREDDSGELQAIEARQVLWGSRLVDFPEDDDWKLLKEARGIELLIHQSLLPDNVEVNTQKRLWLITRNYINYTPVGQAGYVDCRFVGIEDGRGMER